ncbi:MAG: hypothetical protein C0617_14130 [Desulfuromonas sp.]|nr:MAG: hypothetical protein C0617_14130 [Desulfuromonas sp.]
MEYSFRIDDREIHIGVVGIETFFDLPKTGMAIQPFLEAVRKQGGFSILHHPSRVIGDFGNETLQGFDFIEAWNLRHDIRYAPNRGIVAQAKRADFKGRFLASRDTHGFREKDRFPAIEMRREGTALSEKAILSSLAGGEYKLFTKGWDLRPDGTFKPRHRLFGFLPRLSLIHHNFYEMARRLYKRGVKVPPPKWLVKMMK